MPRSIVVLIISLFTLHATAQNSIIYVNATATGLNNGSSWQDAYTDLQTALQTAAQGDSVWVTKHLYYPTTTADRNISFEIPNGIDLIGGFIGNESDIHQRPDSSWTTLSGNIADTALRTDNTNNVLYIDALQDMTTIDGFIIRDGYSLGTFADPRRGRVGNGAGVYVFAREGGGCLHINNCQFIDNQASLSGGAVYVSNIGRDCEGTAIRVTNSTFENNQTTYLEGGAISLDERGNNHYSSFITDCQFKANKAGSVGGAIHLYDNHNCGEFSISNCDFIENEAGSGGAISHIDRHFTGGIQIQHCIFKGNGAGGLGGAIFHMGEDTTQTTFINDCQFIENTSNEAGGAIAFESGVIQVGGRAIPAVHHYFKNNVFIANSSGGGSAMLTETITTTFANCIFAKNKATEGGTVKLSTNLIGTAHPHELSHCLFLNNNASTWGGAVEIRANGIPTKFSNCIFNNNTANIYPMVAPFNARLHFESCLFQDIDSCADIPYVEPYAFSCEDINNLFREDPLFIDPTNHDYRLDFCSPAVNRGSEDGISTSDFDGNPRIVDNKPDIGPYEIQAFPDIEIINYTVEPSCASQATGRISFELANHCPPLHYRWSRDVYAGAGTMGLRPGLHRYNITNFWNAGKVEIDIEVPGYDSLRADFDILPASGIDAADGAVVVHDVWGGMPPYQVDVIIGSRVFPADSLSAGNYFLQIKDSVGCREWFRLSIPVVTDTEEYQQTKSIKLFPNPISNEGQVQLYIPNTTFPQLPIRIFDTQGCLIKQEIIARTNGRYWRFIPPKVAGLYFVELQLGERVEVLKLVKQ